MSFLPQINAYILTSAYSAGAAGASQMLHSLASDGDASTFFVNSNRFGTPNYSTGISSLFRF